MIYRQNHCTRNESVMKEINLDELKIIQIQILDKVHQFCLENNISYWIDCGTLLGSIRHKGYIPWDDDIDIGMLREDYDLFCKTFNGYYPYYSVVCYENNKSFYVPHAKVIDERTVLLEEGHSLSVNIDLFVYDNAPSDEAKVNRMFNIRDFYRKIYPFTVAGKEYISKERRIHRKILFGILSLIPGSIIIKLMIMNSKKYSCINTNFIGNFTSYARVISSKDNISSFIDGEFEGKLYKIPIGYDNWLRSFYGDYMQLPPEEKRVSHHTFKAYFI